MKNNYVGFHLCVFKNFTTNYYELQPSTATDPKNASFDVENDT